MPDHLNLTPEYWKQLLTPSLVKALGELLKKNGRDLLQHGELREWKQRHAEAYWAGVEDLLGTHYPRMPPEDDKAIFQNALAGTFQERLKQVKNRLIVPLYTKELRQSVFAWFQLAAPAFYAVGLGLKVNAMDFR